MSELKQFLHKPAKTKVLQDLLALCDTWVGRKKINAWTPLQRAQAHLWAWKTHLRASDNPVRVPARPDFLPPEGRGRPRGL